MLKLYKLPISILIGVMLLPITVLADASQIKSHGYDLDAADEFADKYRPNHVGMITLEPSQLPKDVQTKTALVKKFSIRDDIARSDKFVYADACDEMIFYFSGEKLLKMTFEVSGACD